MLSESPNIVRKLQQIVEHGRCIVDDNLCSSCDRSKKRKCLLLEGIHTNDYIQFCFLAKEKAKILLKKIIFKEKTESWVYRITSNYAYWVLAMDITSNDCYYGGITVKEMDSKFEEYGCLFILEDGECHICITESDSAHAYGFIKKFQSIDQAFNFVNRHLTPVTTKVELELLGWEWVEF